MVHAQNPARGVIDGVVTDTSLKPIEGVRVDVVGYPLSVATGANGRFRVLGLAVGDYLLSIRRVGFSPSVTPIRVDADTARVAVELTPTVVELARMVTTATVAPSVLREFENRRVRGTGQYKTAAEIDRLNFTATSSVLRTFQSVAVGEQLVTNTRGYGALDCPLRIFVDGMPIQPHGDLDSYLPPASQIAGIEVYTNSATVPAQYATSAGGNASARPATGSSPLVGAPSAASCGVILFWTRR